MSISEKPKSRQKASNQTEKMSILEIHSHGVKRNSIFLFYLEKHVAFFSDLFCSFHSEKLKRGKHFQTKAERFIDFS